MIILTSFRESLNLVKYSAYSNAKLYSVSRFQPKGFNYIPLPFFAAIDKHGNKLSLSTSGIQGYIDDLYGYYDTVMDDIDEWVNNLKLNDIDILCCWCPYASHSRKQMKTYNTFICHIGLVVREVEIRRDDIMIFMDYDHYAYLEDRFKPNSYQMLRL